jgi:LysM repeat protein
MARLVPSRQWIAASALIIGISAWLLIGAAVVIDSVNVKSTPTAVPVVIQPTMVPTLAATLTPIAPSATLPPTQNATLLMPSPTGATATSQSPTPEPPVATEISATQVAAVPTESISGGSGTVSTASCTPPSGWVAYTIEPGDTLFGFQLGSKGQIDVNAIMQGNCLSTKLISIGQTLFLPPGVAENSPKVDDDVVPGVPSLPGGPTRAANCPCTIVVRAGWRLEQIAGTVDKTPVGFSGADFLSTVAAGAPAPDLDFLRSRPSGKSLEGFMFPGTYTLDNGTSAVQFRDMLLSAFGANVNGQIQADAAARGISFWEVVVLASVVQRESYAANEQQLIASVFYNRLAANKGIAATVTLQYALGRPGNWWPRIIGGTINTKSPYNTNIYAGLPPSPIASPGLSAILAAVYPPQTTYQFFSAKCGGGGNFYTETFAEFEQGLKCN